jgi:hypothetical protein
MYPGADPAVGRAGLKPPYRCHDNGAPPNFYRHERDGGTLEVEDELSPLFYEFLDPPLHVSVHHWPYMSPCCLPFHI